VKARLVARGDHLARVLVLNATTFDDPFDDRDAHEEARA